MKFKITRQVPGLLRYEYAALEIEGDHKPDGAEFAEAVSAADIWAEEQRQKLPEKVLSSLVPEAAPAPYVAPAPQAAPKPTPHAVAAPRPAQAAQDGNTMHGPLGYPVGLLAETMARIFPVATRNGKPLATDQNGMKMLERDFHRAGAVYTSKTGKQYFSIKNTMAEYAADIKAKGWDLRAVTFTWERMLKLFKILESDGSVTLTVPIWDKERGGRVDQQVRYEIPLAGSAQESMNMSDTLPPDDDVPF